MSCARELLPNNELYPDFIEQLNNLLQEQHIRPPKDKGSLTTELRIQALIRLGIKDSSEIATLLFYSPQTIYNYRSAMKSKAKNRETFEQDVAQLCTVVGKHKKDAATEASQPPAEQPPQPSE